MSRTNRQSESSRSNGALSNGPKTEEGKARSSQNSLKHGLNSDKILVLQTERQEDYDSLRAAYLKRFAPQDEVELELVDEMVGAKWRLRRIRSIETETMDMRMDDQAEYIRKRGENPSGSRRQAMAFKSLSDTSQALNVLTRYETRLQRTYDRAFENLKKLRAFPYPEEPLTPSALIEMKPRLVVDETNPAPPAEPITAEPAPTVPHVQNDKPATVRPLYPYQILERTW
ncbi:MAG TPA: hypothetical protein VEX68_07060 [Bryobacteraceae bacterium]|nr:hypothetical protein [Bryobacteraceae bacterium]